MIKLNVGCGPDIKPTDKGWVNIDGNQNEGVNLVLDLANQELPFPPNTIDHILAQNIIEHISRHKQTKFITNLYNKLKVGGTITIEMPNLECIAERYLGLRPGVKFTPSYLTTEQAAGFLFGAQEDDFGCHRWIYDKLSLQNLLQEIGFVIYYMDEIRGTNLICKAIKPNWQHQSKGVSLEDAIFDCAISNSPYYIIESRGVKAASVLAVRLSEFGRVFCYGDLPEFDNENIINILSEPKAHFIYKSSAIIAHYQDNGIVEIAKGFGIKVVNLIGAIDIEETVKWITQED